MLEAADASLRAGRLSVARQLFVDAALLADNESDAPALVAAALGAGGIWVSEHRGVIELAAVRSLWERAAALTTPGSLEEARLAVRMAAESVYEGASPAAVLTAFERVREHGDDLALAEGLYGRLSRGLRGA